MPKPLLTDEMIERANRGEDISGPRLWDSEETKIMYTNSDDFGYSSPNQLAEESLAETLHIQVEPTVVKSRRIENEKRNIFKAKLNFVLFWVIILMLALIAAVIWL
ncbi:hypothetical protein STRDD10_00452 [Streptococcus sp. DD10]|uniref:cell wall synthase accessory phosphoprotein MacP n=1 Tax=Streptococcus sp. DD10 TaxID=1777878 RepID=UPI000793BC0F|nr:cell wall synthase accessory phosphoprotein MacP [Streptococcus sp. DD10]KXT75120.1 hypothetical protein STRDD10_00452 [Streptococcus sp. DD10]